MRSAWWIILLIIIGVFLNSAVLRGIAGNPKAHEIKNKLDQPTKPLELSPERGRFLLTQNLANYGSFSLSKEQADAAYPDVGYFNGKYYIYFAPGISVFALPFYLIGYHFHLSQVFSFFMVSVFATANLVMIFLIGKKILRMPIWASMISALIYGFSSVAWSYSGTLYQHQTTTFFILFSFFSVWKFSQSKRFAFMWASIVWLCYGLAIFLDYPNALLLFPVIVYFFLVSFQMYYKENTYQFSFRLSVVFSSVFFILVMLLHGYYNHIHFGSWKKVSGSLIGYKTIKENKLDNGTIEENYKKLKQLEAKKNPVNFFKETDLVKSSYTLLIAPDKGIFVFNPIFLLSSIGIYYLLKKNNREKNILLSLVIINVFLYSSWGDPWGGWAFGPRYLIPAMALLSLFVGYGLVCLKKIWVKLLVIPLFVFSSAVSLMGALTTNAVPPYPEAIYLKSKYGFFFTIDFLLKGSSSSYFYNSFFSSNISLIHYYLLLLFLLSVFFLFFLFILPLWEESNR